MWKKAKQALVFLPFLIVKILTAIQTGWDTYHVTHSLLKVLLIDGAFLALWLYLAYAGQGRQDRINRIYASVVAVALYGIMLLIGWESSPGWASIGVRFAGGAVLFWDIFRFTSQEVATWWTGLQKRSEARKQVEFVYGQQMEKLLKIGIKAARKQLQPKINNAVYNELEAMVPRYVRAQSARAASVVDGEVVDLNERSRALTVPSQSIVDNWRKVSEALDPGDIFKRVDVEDIASCAKTYASQIVNYGLQIGQAQEAPGKGMYVFIGMVEDGD